jgi:hypothetical protein
MQLYQYHHQFSWFFLSFPKKINIFLSEETTPTLVINNPGKVVKYLNDY